MRFYWNLILILGVMFIGCDDADIASRNLSKAADNFEVVRRVVFYNGITDTYILTIEGRCSIYDDGMGQLEITCKTGTNVYKKALFRTIRQCNVFCRAVR